MASFLLDALGLTASLACNILLLPIRIEVAPNIILPLESMAYTALFTTAASYTGDSVIMQAKTKAIFTLTLALGDKTAS